MRLLSRAHAPLFLPTAPDRLGRPSEGDLRPGRGGLSASELIRGFAVKHHAGLQPRLPDPRQRVHEPVSACRFSRHRAERFLISRRTRRRPFEIPSRNCAMRGENG